MEKEYTNTAPTESEQETQFNEYYLADLGDPHNVIVFGDSKNDESAVINAKLLDMLDGENSEGSGQEDNHESISKQDTGHRGERVSSKHKQKKSPSKKRNSQNQKPRIPAVHRIGATLGEMLQKNKTTNETSGQDSSRFGQNTTGKHSPNTLSAFASPEQSQDSINKNSHKPKPFGHLNLQNCPQVDQLLAALPSNTSPELKLNFISRIRNEHISPSDRKQGVTGFKSLAVFTADNNADKESDLGPGTVSNKHLTIALGNLGSLGKSAMQMTEPKSSEFAATSRIVRKTTTESVFHGPLKSSRTATKAVLDNHPHVAEVQANEDILDKDPDGAQHDGQAAHAIKKKPSSRQSSASHRAENAHNTASNRAPVTLESLIKDRAKVQQNK